MRWSAARNKKWLLRAAKHRAARAEADKLRQMESHVLNLYHQTKQGSIARDVGSKIHRNTSTPLPMSESECPKILTDRKEDDFVDIESCNEINLPVLAATNIHLLLSQFEAAERVNNQANIVPTECFEQSNVTDLTGMTPQVAGVDNEVNIVIPPTGKESPTKVQLPQFTTEKSKHIKNDPAPEGENPRRKLSLEQYRLRRDAKSTNSVQVNTDAIFPDSPKTNSNIKQQSPIVDVHESAVNNISYTKAVFDPIGAAYRKILMKSRRLKAAALRRDEDLVMSKTLTTKTLELKPLLSEAEVMEVVGTQASIMPLPMPAISDINQKYDEIILVSIGTNTEQRAEKEQGSKNTPPDDSKSAFNFTKMGHGEDKVILHLEKSRIKPNVTSSAVQTDYMCQSRELVKISETLSPSSRRRNEHNYLRPKKYMCPSTVEDRLLNTQLENRHRDRSRSKEHRTESRRDVNYRRPNSHSRGHRRSRSPNTNRSRSRGVCGVGSTFFTSSSGNCSGSYKKQNRYKVNPHRSFHSSEDRESNTPIEKNRIVFVGRLEKTITKHALRAQFIQFGIITEVRLHSKDDGTLYGFLTFARPNDAWVAVAAANTYPQYDIGFGGRRAFCRQRYADLDAMEAKFSEGAFHGRPTLTTPRNDEMSFDQILEEMKNDLHIYEGC